uniref:Uncharacterized protein n=1 Tax=Romanomermis culicivorax TaxID=13658 RepID=A0A915IKQ8_ROMCU
MLEQCDNGTILGKYEEGKKKDIVEMVPTDMDLKDWFPSHDDNSQQSLPHLNHRKISCVNRTSMECRMWQNLTEIDLEGLILKGLKLTQVEDEDQSISRCNSLTLAFSYILPYSTKSFDTFCTQYPDICLISHPKPSGDTPSGTTMEFFQFEILIMDRKCSL